MKPDAAIYERLCNKFSLKAEECVFADDKIENIEATRRFGMEGIYFKDAMQYEEELRTILSQIL